MPLPKRLERFVEINSAGRVAMLCRAMGILGSGRMTVYTRAVQQAVLAMPASATTGVAEVEAYLNGQLALLKEALKHPPPPQVPKRLPVEPLDRDPPSSRPTRQLDDAELPHARSMPEKLEDSRNTLRRILQEDCVRLELLTPARAGQLCRQLAGKLRRDAEAELMAELRDNLQQQIRAYMRKYRGGPWVSPREQEGVRLDILNTHSVHAVVSLARHLSRECRTWEEQVKRGRLGGLFRGRPKAGDDE